MTGCSWCITLVEGRTEIALAFNQAVRNGTLKAPVVISRDHHDVSGTDSPYRETSNIADGSKFCAGKPLLLFYELEIACIETHVRVRSTALIWRRQPNRTRLENSLNSL